MENEWQIKEANRIDALMRYGVLDTPPDFAIDSIVKSVAAICETPIALVTLLDSTRQWFKSSVGVSMSQMPRDQSFCTHAIENPDQLMIVEDATKDSRVSNNFLVTSEPKIRFYAGKPLVSPQGHVLGTLCVLDVKTRTLSKSQLDAISNLARAVTELLGRQEQSMFSAISAAVDQTLQHGVSLTDIRQKNNPIVYCNKAFESITGYSQSEIIGRNYRFLQGENSDPDTVDRLRKAVGDEKQLTVLIQNYRKSGVSFWNELTISPIANHAGITTHFIGIMLDVSERFKVEASLAQSRKFLESAPDAMIFSDQDGVIKMANSAAVIMYGYSNDELINMHVDLLAPERYRARQKESRRLFVSDADAREKMTDVVLSGLTKNGEELHLDVRLSLIEGDDQTLISASMRDISAKVAAEIKLRKTQERYRDLFENSSDLIQSVNPDGSFSYTNPAWLNTFGYTIEEVSKMSIFDMVHPDNYDHCVSLSERVMSGESVPFVQVTFATKLKKPIYLEGSLSTYVVENKVKAIRTIFRDVTERIESEKKLLISKEKAENATLAKSRFLAAASHDLRQPLQSASMYMSALERQLENPKEAANLCNMAGKSLDVMGRLLDVLLDITRLDSGGISVNYEHVQLQDVLDSTVASNRQQAEEKGLRFHCEHHNAVLYTDITLLERIIDNFVSNAIRYTDQGEINIRCERQEEQVVISVCDSGIGIPLEKQSAVFEEYYQLENEARDRNKGLGLGLSIVKRIADLIDHPLRVSSEPGKGSTFSVCVPLGPNQTELFDNSVNTQANQCDELAPVVLLIDDDELVLMSTRRLLRTYDMTVHSAQNGDDAMLLINDGLVPDFILSDFRLPNYDGIELVQRIRSKLGRDIPTAIMTGDTSTPRIVNASLENFTVLNKPIYVSELLKLIRDGAE